MAGSMWFMLLFIFVAGAGGGAVNALMTDNGFLMPKSEQATSGSSQHTYRAFVLVVPMRVPTLSKMKPLKSSKVTRLRVA
jgi:hypothetical protein